MMHFGATLRRSIYEPWTSKYIDYAELKRLLRENEPEDDGKAWTECDEARFVEELLNVQLEKVNAFQGEICKDLGGRATHAGAIVQKLCNTTDVSIHRGNDKFQKELDSILYELNDITEEINELQKYSRLNFTGFLKAAKKHDRKRGSRYKVRPLLQVRLAALHFNAKDYSPLLYELSTIYSAVRQVTEGGPGRARSLSEDKAGGERCTSYKFWVHYENLLEVKTYILRRLPVLVYNPQPSRVAGSSGSDPTVTSLYFDNAQFSLYNKKVGNAANASSLRLKWFGHLRDKPELLLEKATVREGGVSDGARVALKEKYVQPFITGKYKMEKSVEKLQDREGIGGNGVASLKQSVQEIQMFIKENALQPILRANYTRTAFQIPGDDEVRISIDTDLVFVREDSLDGNTSSRSPDGWHRNDIDRLGLKYPFSEIRQGEVSRFPHALLEIKLRKRASKKRAEWIHDLMSSHLLKEAAGFSKFVHGVAELFEDQVNSFPFWLSDLETDIRRDPEEAFREETRARRAAGELAVGTLVGSKSVTSFKAVNGSPIKRSPIGFGQQSIADVEGTDQGTNNDTVSAPNAGVFSGILSSASFSNSKFARAHRDGAVHLPPGVRKPEKLIQDINPVSVEPKVWLANQRTFVKWQHVSILLASLSLGLYNAAGENNHVARGLAVLHTLTAIFTGLWGWWMYIIRSRMIRGRSGKNFDNIVGPIFICLGLLTALCLNFGFKV